MRLESISRRRPDASVILVSYNTRALTLAALRAIRDSSIDPDRIETIVVDNGSRDGSVNRIAAEFPDVVLIPVQENLGFGKGNNRGAEYATGRLLFFLNTDTEVDRNAIGRLVDAIEGDPSVGIVGARLRNPDGSDQRSVLCVPTVRRIFCEFFWLDRTGLGLFSGPYDNRVDPDTPADVEAVHGAALMIRRDLFEQIGRFDPDYFMYFDEDDLCRRAIDSGAIVRYVPGAEVMHHISASYRDRPWWFYRISRASRSTFARKHLSVPSRIAIHGIVHSGYALRIVLYLASGLFNRRLGRLGRMILRSYVDRRGPDRPEREER